MIPCIPLLLGEDEGEGMDKKILFARQLRKDQTDVEQILWEFLRNRRFNAVKFRRQHPIGPYVVDFVSLDKKLIIELDGGQHNTESGKEKDKERKIWLEQQGFQLLRFWNNEVISDLDNVLEVIHNALTSPRPSPRRRGGS